MCESMQSACSTFVTPMRVYCKRLALEQFLWECCKRLALGQYMSGFEPATWGWQDERFSTRPTRHTFFLFFLELLLHSQLHYYQTPRAQTTAPTSRQNYLHHEQPQYHRWSTSSFQKASQAERKKGERRIICYQSFIEINGRSRGRFFPIKVCIFPFLSSVYHSTYSIHSYA